jgi:hypothetical protein
MEGQTMRMTNTPIFISLLMAVALSSSFARAADIPTEPGAVLIPPADHRREFVLRAGIQLPGEITPKNMAIGKASVAPMVLGEVDAVIHPLFTIGAFTHISSADYQHTIGDQPIDDGRITLMSVGASLKARIPIGDRLVLRAGFLIGTNFVWASGKSNDGSSYGAHGVGIDIAPTVEFVWRISKDWGCSAQFAFVAQPAGEIAIDGDPADHDDPFAPIYFLAIGPEFYL